jgi:hypothetical protein
MLAQELLCWIRRLLPLMMIILQLAFLGLFVKACGSSSVTSLPQEYETVTVTSAEELQLLQNSPEAPLDDQDKPIDLNSIDEANLKTTEFVGSVEKLPGG